MSNFDFTKTLLSGNKQYIDKITNDIAEKANNPDWNNLKNRPFYEEPTETSILSGTYEFEMWADFYGSTLPYTELTIGVIYDVIFDGITYSNLECRASENPDIKSYLGSSYDELLNDNHEYNFTIYQEVEFFTVYTTSTESSHSIEIIEKESTIKTLDSKYIPDIIARTEDIPTETVMYSEQELTEEQQEQVRANIGAASMTEFSALSEEITESLTEKEASGTADSKVSEHNTSETSHSDIRLLIEGLTTRLNALADSDDTTLDQMSEVVAYIKSNKTLIEAITTNKVSVSDIVDNLTTSASNKPLSAKQGVALKALIDAIVVPKKTSQLTNDSGFLTEHQDISGLAPKATTLSGYGITDGATKEQFNQLSEEISDLFICTEDNNLVNLMRKLDAGFVQGNFTSTTETDDLYWCKMAKPLGGQNLYIVADDNVMYYIAKYSSITGKFIGYVDNGIDYKKGNYSLPFVYGVDYRVRVRPVEGGNELKPDNCGIKIYTTAFEDVNSYTLANEQCVRTQIKNIHIDENYYKTQGMCILNGIAYIVRTGDSDDSKIIAYDIANDKVVSETIVNVGHGNSLATDGIYIYCCSTGYIYKFAVDSYLLSLIESYDVTEHNFIAMTNFGENTFILLDSKTNAMYRTTDFKIFYKISNVYTRPNKGEIQTSKQSIAYDGKYVYLIISEWDYTFIYKYTNHLRGVCLYHLNTKRYYEAESMYIYNNKMYVAENTMNKDGKCFLNIISTVEECLESIYS